MTERSRLASRCEAATDSIIVCGPPPVYLRAIDFTDPADAARHDRMVALVTQMLDLHARLAAEGVPHEVAALQRRIEMTDRQIDRLVHELYALTPEEIAVVEGAG